ncbi:MAG: sulfotransferase domain-containing protein [Candidatus Thiodiazotropha sp. DIVDIV]
MESIITNDILPKFMCVGTQKAGTTTLHSYLLQHPKICLPSIKETDFFQDDEKYFQGLDFYKKYYPDCSSNALYGEVEPEYMYFENVPNRLLKDLGQHLKIIFILRDPVNRSYSHYMMNRNNGFENEKFDTAIAKEEERINRDEDSKKKYSYISRSLYVHQINRYLSLFKKENILFLLFEDDLVKDPKSTMERVFSFLDIDSLDITIESVKNKTRPFISKHIGHMVYRDSYAKELFKKILPSSKYREALKNIFRENSYEKLKSEDRKKLINNYFYDDICEIERIINRNLDSWKQE